MIVLRNLDIYDHETELFEFIMKIYSNLNIVHVKSQIHIFLFSYYDYLAFNENEICAYKNKKDLEDNVKEELFSYFLSQFIEFLRKLKDFNNNNSVIIKIENNYYDDIVELLKIKYNTNRYNNDLTFYYNKKNDKYIIINDKYCSNILYGNLFEIIKNNYKIIDSITFIRNEKINNLFKNELK